MDSPKARIERDGANTGIKIMTAIHAIKNIIVCRQPKRSWLQALTSKPASWPTSEELDRPDCHVGEMTLWPRVAS
jgi:hypothetical protein